MHSGVGMREEIPNTDATASGPSIIIGPDSDDLVTYTEWLDLPESDVTKEMPATFAPQSHYLRACPSHKRAGITKNHGRPRNKVRAKMSRESRRLNRGR